jgi:hypothetical protein
MRDAAGAGVTDRELARLRFCGSDELLHRLRLNRRRNDQHHRRRGDLCNGREALHRVIAGVAVKRVIDRERDQVLKQQRVAVVRRFRDKLRRKQRSAAGTIVYDGVLSEHIWSFRRQEPRDEVRAAARREWHDETQWPVRKGTFGSLRKRARG